MTRRLVLALCLCTLAVYTSAAADTIRVCTYNVLNYGAGNDDGRIPMYAKILQQIKPDILLCGEVADNTMGAQFVSQVLTWSSFAFAPFIDGPDSDNQLFYDQTKFTYLQSKIIPTELRNILEVQLATIPESGRLPDTVVCYLVHLKASDDEESAAQRTREATILHNNLAHASYIIVAGDCNFYGPSEHAYQTLIASSTGTNVVDPLGTSWQRNVASQAHLYTQCTRMNNIKGCGGGVTGGVDDRFDFIFVSQPLVSRIVPNSYTAFGNDGIPRLNSSINDPPNTAVSAEIADALLCASDHLPVYVDLVLTDVRASVKEWQGALPTASFVGDELVISHCPLNQLVVVTDMRGRTIHSGLSAAFTYTAPLPGLARGTYMVRVGNHTSVVVK